ncbi:fibronectin type III domain-containing protein [Oceanicoccus sp. KOV_DT_Chl]|uniref:fibronectin type III domain-containing protein n=1 Tax=Oceanicoccus sp. KOV_DT_Chl TaxID=1904639 RepID=UPI000C7E55E1|nr:fibronectin type III domain-containing protein [Oceanicoccus sp. KOV_DT_Chl]
MKAVLKNVLALVFLQMFVMSAYAVNVEDYRSYTADVAAKKFEGFLSWSMSNRNVQRYDISYQMNVSEESDTCGMNTPQQVSITSPEQVISLINNMPIAEVRFDVTAFDDQGSGSKWLVLINKTIDSPIATSGFSRDFSDLSYDTAKSRMVDGVLGWYQNNRDVEQYEITYLDVNSGAEKTVVINTNTELSAVMDQLSAGNYKFIVDTVFTSGVVATRELAFNKLASDLPQSKSLQIAWSAPTTRENGTELKAGDIAGYEVYYTAMSNSNALADELIAIEGNQTSFQLTDLNAGEYHFAIATIDNTGLKSNISEVVTVTIN